jgi:hypothetical protein
MEMNMNVRVTSLWMKTVENATKEIARECVLRCAEKYGFNGEEAISELFVKTDVVEMKKRSSGKKEVKEVKEVKDKKVKSNLMLPFSKVQVNVNGCCGLAYNQGLFTQCPKKKMEQGKYCKTCQKEADESASGIPNNGTIEQRVAVGLMEFRDPKGRSPIRYSKIMEKQGLTRGMVEDEARKLNYEIDEEHFNVVDNKEDGKRGRPKVEKKKKVATNATVEDLFAKIVREESNSPVPGADTEVMTDSEEEKDQDTFTCVHCSTKFEANRDSDIAMCKDCYGKSGLCQSCEIFCVINKDGHCDNCLDNKLTKEAVVKKAKAGKSEAEKAAKAADKLAKEEKLAAEKAAKAEKLAAEKAAKAEKLAAEKAAKEAKIAADKAAKAEKLAAEKAAKEEPKKEKKEKTEKKVDKKVDKKEEVEKPKEEEPVPGAKKVTVTRITINGVQYLKTLDNILYNPDTKEEIGIYDKETNTIQPLLDDSDEEELTADGYETN